MHSLEVESVEKSGRSEWSRSIRIGGRQTNRSGSAFLYHSQRIGSPPSCLPVCTNRQSRDYPHNAF